LSIAAKVDMIEAAEDARFGMPALISWTQPHGKDQNRVVNRQTKIYSVMRNRTPVWSD
jgi:hypothetical protein